MIADLAVIAACIWGLVVFTIIGDDARRREERGRIVREIDSRLDKMAELNAQAARLLARGNAIHHDPLMVARRASTAPGVLADGPAGQPAPALGPSA